MILEIIININKAFDNIFLALSLSFSPKAIENIGAPPKPTKKANEVIKLKVPVTFEGQGALETNRLVLETFASEIEVQGAVEKLPEKIEIDVSNKKFEDKILAKDITLPEGVHLVTAEDTLLALVAGTEGEPEEEEAETDEKTE